MFPNVRSAVPSPKDTDIPDGWITHSIHTENVPPAVTVSTAAQKRYIPMKTAICTVITLSVMAVVRSWKVTGIPDGAITPSAAIPVLSADILNPVPIPAHLQNIVI